MKNLVFTFLSLGFISATSQAQLLVSWERWADPASDSSRGAFQSIDPNVDGTATYSDDGSLGTHWASAGFGGSYDGTFGSNLSGADTLQAGIQAIRTFTTTSSAYIDFLVENNTGSESYELAEFHFDAWRAFTGSPASYDLEVLTGSDITVGTLVSGGAFAVQGSNPATSGNDYEDFDHSLTSLADRTLAPGESATFRLTIASGSANLYVDNIALSVIPEPGSALLLGVAGAMILFPRRRH